MTNVEKADILTIANALMALPEQDREAIINRAYGMCMYALAVQPDDGNDGDDDKKTA